MRGQYVRIEEAFVWHSYQAISSFLQAVEERLKEVVELA